MAESCKSHIPDDLHPLILKNLLSKPLVKFTIVSKSWSSLIKSPYFISLHLNQQQKSNNNKNPQFLLQTHKGFFISRYIDSVGRRGYRLPTPPDGFISVVASSRTLICLSSGKDQNTLLLWNPSINRFKKIVRCSYDRNRFAFGVTDNKIVMIGYNTDSLELDDFDSNTLIPPYAKVYCVNNKQPSLGWKHIPIMCIPLFSDDDDGRRLSRISRSGYIVNGVVHWIVFRYDFDNVYEFGFGEHGDCILTFDPKSDTFGVMRLPTPLTEVDGPDLSLAVVDDCLAVIQHSGTQQGIIRVWRRMEEYGVEEDSWSWNISYKITLSCISNLKFWAQEEGKKFITTNSGKLIAFNVDTGVGHFGMTGGQAFDFTQSLLLLE